MLIIGHRGAAGTAPENTKASIFKAIGLGVEWIEVDVQPTKDHHLVVAHDHKINRCSNGKGRIDEQTLADLKQYDFGSWFGSDFTDEEIMTLSELLEIAQKHHIKLNLEIKIDKHDPEYVAKLLHDVLNQYQSMWNELIISSFNHDALLAFKTHNSSIRLGALCERVTKPYLASVERMQPYSCHLNFTWTKTAQVESLKGLGYQVYCYTVNKPSDKLKMLNLDGIFTDYPERFI